MKIVESIKYYELESIEAQSFDEIYYLYRAHVSHAYLVRNLDADKALELLNQAKKIKKTLGFDVEEDWIYHNIRASVHNVRGEFGLSLKCYQEAMPE